MTLPEQLLEQARHLATRDVAGRPRQGNLRRAVSDAYYALFDFLVDRGCRYLISGRAQEALRGVLARAFEHGTMKRASTSFASGSLPAKLLPALTGSPVPPDLQRIARAFRDLQEARHAADYDPLRRFRRSEVLAFVEQAQQAIQLWPAVRDTPAGRLYLVGLLVGEQVRG
jgi:hypothetical protein